MAKDLRQVIRHMPMRTGLVTAGQQSTVAEDALWRADNVTARFDGLVQRRPGLEQWGQTIKTPSVDAVVGVHQKFSNLADWVIDTSAAGDLISFSVNNNVLNMVTQVGAGTQTLSFGRYLQGTEVQPTGDDWSLRFSAKGTNLHDYGGSDTTADALVIRAIAAAASGKEFALMKDGLYYKADADDTYTLISAAGTDDDEQWHQYEIHMDKSGNTLVYIDDTLVATIVSALIKSVTPTPELFQFEWRTDTSAQYYWSLSDVQYADTVTTPFVGGDIDALQYLARRTSVGGKQDIILAFSDKKVWQDRNAEKHWVPLLDLPDEKMFFGRFRDNMLFINSHEVLNTSVVYEWDGSNRVPVKLEQAPPMAFAVEHKGRIWAAGDKRHPLRVYFSGNRQSDVWFVPEDDAETVDNVLEAGYIEIKSDGGDEVTAMYGDFYGQLIIFTRRSVWRLVGDGFDTFSVGDINRSVGCVGPNAVSRVANDLLFLSREGVHSLVASEQSGDLRTSFVSSFIQDLWTETPSTGFRLRDPKLLEPNVRYMPVDNLVYISLHKLQDELSEITYVYNLATKQWFGPWDIQTSALTLLEFSGKSEQLMMHGQSGGIVATTARRALNDLGVDYTVTIESPRINGRSIDPTMVPLKKVWKTLRLYIMPRGAWDFTVTWQTDANAPNEDKPDNTQTQNFYGVATLTNNFRLGDPVNGRLKSNQLIAPIEIELGETGRWLRFVITQNGVNQNFVLQGYEVEFVPGRTEKG